MTEFPPNLVEAIIEKHKPEPTRRLSFLIGSGFSRPDGMPLVGEINQRLSQLKETDFYLYQDMTAGFYKDNYRDLNAKITLNDRRIAEEFIAFYLQLVCKNDPEQFNYEDFFDYFSEFLYEKLHEDEVEAFCKGYREKYGLKGHFENGLNYLGRFLNIFNQLVASLLTFPKYYRNVSYTGGYTKYENISRLFKKLLKDYKVHVHSLNHDMLFDHIGSSVSGIAEYFTDGFTEAGSPYFGELRYSPKVNEAEFYKTYHVRLKHFTNNFIGRLSFYKLHGSIDYFPTYLQGSNEPVTIKRDYGIGEILRERFNEQKEQFEYENPFTNKYPAFLTGTTQKIKRYDDSFFVELFNHFKDNLENSEKLIVIGYGFQDKGINEMLENNFLKKGKIVFVVDVRRVEVDLFKAYPDNFFFSSGGVTETSYNEYIEFLSNK